MHTLLVAGTAAAGLVLGGVLDPIGQRLADLSQAEDERRLAEQREKAAYMMGRRAGMHGGMGMMGRPHHDGE